MILKVSLILKEHRSSFSLFKKRVPAGKELLPRSLAVLGEAEFYEYLPGKRKSNN